MSIYNDKTKYKGFSLVEILVAVGVFAIVTVSIAGLFTTLSVNSTNDSEMISAQLEMRKMVSLVVKHKGEAWYEIMDNSDGNQKYISIVEGGTAISDGVLVENGYTEYFTINNVLRDTSGNIVDSGGSIDPLTKKITLNISWVSPQLGAQSLTRTLYINDWETLKLTDTTVAEFQQGILTDVQIIASDDGEVVFDTVFFPDWCQPELSISEYDIPGDAQSRAVFAQIGHAYLGTRGETTGEPFTKLNITEVDPPIVTVEGTFAGYTVNDIFIDGDYAFLSTTNDGKEVVIVDISSVPYREVGYYNASGSTNAYSTVVKDGIGYVAQGRVVRTFDLSSYTGSRPSIGSITIGWWLASVSQIDVVGNYLYAVLDLDWYELAIVNVSNPASMSITSQTSVNNQQVYDMYVSEDGNRVYFGTNSSSEREFFILDTTSKSGARPIIASVDTNGMTVEGIAVVADDTVVILVGTGGEEYQVYTLENESSPVKCGGMQVNTGIYDIDALFDADGNAFSYIVTGDASDEFKIIRGGEGVGGGAGGYGYAETGDFVSRVFDSTDPLTAYFYLMWNEQLPTGTDLKIQLRASNYSNMSGATWMGPDGTSGTYFTDPIGSPIPVGLSNNRYIQYKVFFTGDGSETPVFEDVSIIYSN